MADVEEIEDEACYLWIACDQCAAVAISGVPCHETGCPNIGRPWVKEGEYLIPGERPDPGWICTICMEHYESQMDAEDCCEPMEEEEDESV